MDIEPYGDDFVLELPNALQNDRVDDLLRVLVTYRHRYGNGPIEYHLAAEGGALNVRSGVLRANYKLEQDNKRLQDVVDERTKAARYITCCLGGTGDGSPGRWGRKAVRGLFAYVCSTWPWCDPCKAASAEVEGENDGDECPTTGESAEDCEMCSGAYCETHGVRPCDCDTADRHKVATAGGENDG